jgi:VWFA-related protein
LLPRLRELGLKLYNRHMKRALAAAAMLLGALTPAVSKETAHAQLNKLNVVALDARGQPVAGLTSSDFQLFEDGKRQDIAFFRFTGDRPALATPVPGEYSNRASAAWHATVVLLDLLSERIVNDTIIGQQVADSLKNLESSEGLYLYFLTARGELYPIHPLPQSATVVTPAAEPWTRNISPMLQGALKDLVRLKPVDDRDIKVRFDLSMHALRDLRSQLAQLSGRKNLVWVTRGIPIVGFSASTQTALDFTEPLRWFGEELEQAQIVVYTVDQSVSGAGTAIGTLDELTSITGGRGYSSGRAGDAIQQARMDSRANYEIAYYSASLNPDGKHHRIRVSCGRKEVRLETERGFYALAPLVSPSGPAPSGFGSRELPPEIETTAHSPFEATEIGLRAAVSPDPIHPQDRRLEVHIDALDLLPRPTRDPDAGKVWIAFVAYDEASKPLVHPVLAALTPEQLAAATHGEIGLSEAIPVTPGVHKVRVVAFDAALGAVGSVTVPIEH